jgi:hypothetical protein
MVADCSDVEVGLAISLDCWSFRCWAIELRPWLRQSEIKITKMNRWVILMNLDNIGVPSRYIVWGCLWSDENDRSHNGYTPMAPIRTMEGTRTWGLFFLLFAENDFIGNPFREALTYPVCKWMRSGEEI